MGYCLGKMHAVLWVFEICISNLLKYVFLTCLPLCVTDVIIENPLTIETKLMPDT